MTDKYNSVEKLDAFAGKLRATKDLLIKIARISEAQNNELIKFNPHGQWSLTKGKDKDKEAKKGEGSLQGDYGMITPGG